MGKNNQISISLIVPIYNMEEFLETCLDSIANQTIKKDKIEVLMINDGSSDGSAEIMEKYSALYPYMKAYHKENEGLSMTRNYGIERAKGKYLMYLDSDDTLSPNSLELLEAFFDKHYDEIDLVTYDEIPIINGKKGKPHYRYQYLQEEGVYDLNEFPYVFCSQTRINVCVKNLGADNVLFDSDRTFRQEDQKYCTQVLQRKMKIGYCPGATYYYLHQPNSIVRTIFYAYYIFESSMRVWEEIFSYYDDKPPYYIQALYLNDINWKTRSDILLPYHYPEDEFEKAKARVQALLDKVDDVVILGHPALDLYQKHHFLSSKTNNEIEVRYESDGVTVFNHGERIVEDTPFDIRVNRFTPRGETVEIIGILQSPILQYIEKPQLRLITTKASDGSISKEDISTTISSYSYHKAKSITSKKYLFRTTIDRKDISFISFAVCINDNEYKCAYSFNRVAPFGNTESGVRKIVREGVEYTSYLDEGFSIKVLNEKELRKAEIRQGIKYIRHNRKLFMIRNTAMREKKKNEKIWLYYDCKGVFKDNAYYQFEHDIEKNDGITRYYVVNEKEYKEEIKKYPQNIQKRCLKFGSKKHRRLFLVAEKVVTAFIERNNYNPFHPYVYKRCLDVFDFPDTYYLQHGVLHAHVPWKYSSDRMMVKKEVISTRFEEENLKQNYCFSDDQLIKAGMPRYDLIDHDAKHGNRILYAPSWRKYLITEQKGRWIANENKFLASVFYKESQEFLNSSELQDLLEKTDSYLDFKLHPIFERYRDLYTIDNPRVSLAEQKIQETDYNIFITDFSSFAFDFAYLNTPVVYFMPDYELFKAGMNYYRELDMPMTDGLGPFVQTSDDLIKTLNEIVDRNYQAEEYYAKKVNNLFFYKDNNQRERIYNEIILD